MHEIKLHAARKIDVGQQSRLHRFGFPQTIVIPDWTKRRLSFVIICMAGNQAAIAQPNYSSV
jgi:hypothetical protein